MLSAVLFFHSGLLPVKLFYWDIEFFTNMSNYFATDLVALVMAGDKVNYGSAVHHTPKHTVGPFASSGTFDDAETG
jgi:hypothetical protein